MFRQRLKTYLRALPRSFYDPAQYRETIAWWSGFGAIYLLIVAAIISLFMVGFVGYSVHLFRKNDLPAIIEQLPTIIIKEGEVSMDREDPVTIVTKTQGIKVIIDPKSSEEDFKKTDAMIGIGKNFAVFKGRKGFETTRFDKDDNIVISQQTIADWTSKLTAGMIPVLYIVALFGQFINYLFQTFLIAIASYILTALIREEYNFETRMRISALALTPALFITNASLIVLHHQMAMWFNVLLALLFLYTMILLMRRYAR